MADYRGDQLRNASNGGFRFSFCELTAGLLMLHRGRGVRAIMGIVFMLGIVPLIGWYLVTNLVTVLPLVALAFFSYPRSLVDVLRRP